ncbi:hypothetical protein PMIN06_010105 [Paraphaeosphaeria minitans]
MKLFFRALIKALGSTERPRSRMSLGGHLFEFTDCNLEGSLEDRKLFWSLGTSVVQGKAQWTENRHLVFVGRKLLGGSSRLFAFQAYLLVPRECPEDETSFIDCMSQIPNLGIQRLERLLLIEAGSGLRVAGLRVCPVIPGHVRVS